MSDVQRAPQGVCPINHHLGRVARCRKTDLTGAVAECLRAIRTAIAAAFEMLALEAMPDRAPPSVSCPPRRSPAETVRRFERPGSRLGMRAFAPLKRRHWGDKKRRAAGDYVGTAGHVSAEMIKRDVEESQHA